jgi:arginase
MEQFLVSMNLVKSGKRRIALLGIPYDKESSFRRGCAGAPDRIRSAWRSPSSNMFSENGVLVDDSLVLDAGDVDIGRAFDPFQVIEEKVESLVGYDMPLVCLGGDHSISYPVVKVFDRIHHDLNILHFDAHPDIYDEFEGSRLSHACPFARIMEAGLAKRLVQVGIRTQSQIQREQIKKFGVEVLEMKDHPEKPELNFDGPVYISFDMDALDPAFAPGVSHREPGGLSTRQAIAAIQSIRGKIVGADIVEYNPKMDIPGMTDMVAAKILKEIAARMIKNGC